MTPPVGGGALDAPLENDSRFGTRPRLLFSFFLELPDVSASPIVLIVKGGQGDMSNSLLRADEELAALYDRHRKTVYRVCFTYMKNPADTEDAVQDTFLRLIKSGPAFESEEHEKAWLIRAASNVCKNALAHWWRRRESLEDHRELPGAEGISTDEVLEAVLGLPAKYKTVVYLYYYEGYTGPEIAGILKRPKSTIRNYLREARAILKERLGDDFCEK